MLRPLTLQRRQNRPRRRRRARRRRGCRTRRRRAPRRRRGLRRRGSKRAAAARREGPTQLGWLSGCYFWWELGLAGAGGTTRTSTSHSTRELGVWAGAGRRAPTKQLRCRSRGLNMHLCERAMSLMPHSTGQYLASWTCQSAAGETRAARWLLLARTPAVHNCKSGVQPRS